MQPITQEENKVSQAANSVPNSNIVPQVPTSGPENLNTGKPIFKKVVLFIGVFIILAGLVVFYKIFTTGKEAVLPTPTPIAKKQLNLTLESPGENDLAIDDEILVKGKTLPNTPVVIYSDDDDTSVVSDGNGNFESTIKLTQEENIIKVTAFAEDGQEKSETVNVSLSPEG